MSTIRKEIERIVAKLKAAEENSKSHTHYSEVDQSLERNLFARGVPRRLAMPIIAGKIDNNQATDLVWDLLSKKGYLLILAGNPGVGKSQAAAIGLSQMPGMWLDVSQLARPETGSIDHQASVCGLLVLEDPGADHSPSGYASSRLNAIVSHREAWLRPTIITTNLQPAIFRERYGDRLASRVNGDPLGWHDIVGPDLRESK
jgi:DNA polymerase III delta prime subunit